MYDSPRCSPRAQRAACWLLGLFIALALVFVPGQPPAASAASILAPTPGSACIGTITGLTNSNTIVVSNATVRTVRMKCNFDPAIGGRYPDSTVLDPPSGCRTVTLQIPDGTNSGAYPCSPSTGYAYQFHDLQFLARSEGYAEISMKVSCPASCASSSSSYRTYNTARRASMRVNLPAGSWPGHPTATALWLGTSTAGSNVTRDEYTGLFMGEAEYEETTPGWRWTAEPEVPSCLALRMFIANPGRTIDPGQSLEVDFVTGWGDVMFSPTTLLRYRWSPTDPFVTFYNASTSTATLPQVQSFTNNTGSARTGVTFEVHCAGDGGAYIRGDNSEGSPTPQQKRACAALTVRWPEEAIYDGGEDVWLTLDVGDTDDEILWIVVHGGRFGNEQSYTLGSVTPVDTITFLNPAGTPHEFPLTTGSYKASFEFENAWNTDDGLAIRCEDADGFLNLQYKAPAAVGKVPIPEGYSDRYEECMSDANFGWRPSSWVPGLIRTGTCVIQVVFVPSEADFNRLADRTDDLMTKSPFGQINESATLLFSFFDDLPDAVDEHRDECMSLGGFKLGNGEGGVMGDEVELCPQQLANGVPEIGTIRNLVAVILWAAIAWNMVTATRRVMQ